MIKFYVGQIIVGITIGVVVYYLTWGRRKNHGNPLENKELNLIYIQELIARQQAENHARGLQSESERRPLALTHTNGECHEAELQNGCALGGQPYDKGSWDNQPTNNSVGITSPPSLRTDSAAVSQTVEPQPPVLPPVEASIRVEQTSAMRRNQLPQGVLFTKLPNNTESDQVLPVTTTITISSLTIGKVFTADPNLADDQQPRIPESRYSLPSDSIFKVSPQQPTQQIAPSQNDHPNNRALALPSAQDHTSSPSLRRKRSLPDVSKLNLFSNKKAKE